jgi:hypothetical protein
MRLARPQTPSLSSPSPLSSHGPSLPLRRTSLLASTRKNTTTIHASGSEGPEGTERRTEENGGTSSSPSSSRPWLEELVPLPGGYKTTRRDALKFLSLGTGLGSFYLFFSRAEARHRERIETRTRECLFFFPGT